MRKKYQSIRKSKNQKENPNHDPKQCIGLNQIIRSDRGRREEVKIVVELIVGRSSSGSSGLTLAAWLNLPGWRIPPRRHRPSPSLQHASPSAAAKRRAIGGVASAEEARRLQEENLRLREEERIENLQRFRDLESQIGRVSGIEMPSTDGLPPSQAKNPWFIGHFVPHTEDDFFNMGIMGIRHRAILSSGRTFHTTLSAI